MKMLTQNFNVEIVEPGWLPIPSGYNQDAMAKLATGKWCLCMGMNWISIQACTCLLGVFDQSLIRDIVSLVRKTSGDWLPHMWAYANECMDIGVWPATGTMDSLYKDLDKWTSGLQDLIAKLAPYADGFQPVFAKVQNTTNRGKQKAIERNGRGAGKVSGYYCKVWERKSWIGTRSQSY